MNKTFLELTLPVLGRVEFPAYMTMLMVGFCAGIWLLRRRGEREGLDGQHLVDLGLLMLVLGVLGARLLSVLTDGHFMDFVHLCTDSTLVPAIDAKVAYCTTTTQCGYDYLCDTARHVCYPPRDCLAAFKFWQGGLTYYGGFLLAVPGGMWYARRKRLGVLRVADLAAPLIMLGLFFGRLGCFFNGCCYGEATDSWVGMRFPGHHDAVHPTQLYEGLAVLALFAALELVVRPRKRAHGEVFAGLLILYPLARSVLELWRADPRGSLGPLSTSQLLSIPVLAAGVALLVWVRRNATPTHLAAPPSEP